MRRITNGNKSGKGFDNRRFTPRTCWAELAQKAGLTLNEEEAKALLKDKPVTVHLNTKIGDIAKNFAETKMQIWNCLSNCAHFNPSGMVSLGDIERIVID